MTYVFKGHVQERGFKNLGFKGFFKKNNNIKKPQKSKFYFFGIFRKPQKSRF